MRGEITYWRCPDCLGTGKIAPHWSNHVEACRRCDATGNALVSGRQREHEREVERRTADAMRRRDGTFNV